MSIHVISTYYQIVTADDFTNCQVLSDAISSWFPNSGLSTAAVVSSLCETMLCRTDVMSKIARAQSVGMYLASTTLAAKRMLDRIDGDCVWKHLEHCLTTEEHGTNSNVCPNWPMLISDQGVSYFMKLLADAHHDVNTLRDIVLRYLVSTVYRDSSIMMTFTLAPSDCSPPQSERVNVFGRAIVVDVHVTDIDMKSCPRIVKHVDIESNLYRSYVM